MNSTLEIFLLLLENKPMSNREIAERLDTNIRNVQRAVEKIDTAVEQNSILHRNFKFERIGRTHTIRQSLFLKEDEILLLIKILISSRSLNEKESQRLIKKMINMVGPDNREVVKKAAAIEHTTELFIDDKSDRQEKLWQLEKYISQNERIEFQYTDYERQEDAVTEKVEILPIHSFFDNYYFFLIGLKPEDHSCITFRIDWMDKIKPIGAKSKIEHSELLKNGEETKQNVYGYRGEATTIYFEYYGYMGYLKDKFPSAEIVAKLDKPNRFDFSVYLIRVKVNYSDGVKLWLLGETTILKVVAPYDIAKDIKDTLYNTYSLYSDDKTMEKEAERYNPYHK